MDRSSNVRRHRLGTSPGVSLSYAEYLPDRRSRGDVLLLHGLASSGLQFHEDAQHFAARDHRVIVPDLRGHGASSVPAGLVNGADFTIATLAGDVVAILDHAQAEAVHWVGNSLGGILALHLLGTPQCDRLASLVLFGTCFSMNLPAQVGQALRLSFLPGAPITAWLTARTTTRSAMGRQSIQTAIRQFNVAAGAAIVANVRQYDFLANARSYDRPLLVLRGGKDRAVNLRLRRDMLTFVSHPNLRQIDLPTAGHCANFDAPEAFRTALSEHWDLASSQP